MDRKRSSMAIGFIALFEVGFACAQSHAIPQASMIEAAIPSGGSRLNAFVYLSAGEGPHPIVILLHGYPGNERNLDLGQAVRRAGYDALYFDYRGSWGSGGTFSFEHGLEDADAALAWVRDPANVAKYRFDAHRIALVGHSTGAWFALMTATHEPADVCVAAIAAENVGWEGQDFDKNTHAKTEALDYFRSTTTDDGPIRADPDELLEQMLKHAGAWDYLALADKLESHPLLLVAATRDTPEEGVAMHGKLVDAIHRAGGRLVRSLVLDDDHPFSSHRLALANALTQWLKSDCAKGQTVQRP
ncbi:MAG: alpha/beta hydrolase family protein [Steroidobacterales bacterium]